MSLPSQTESGLAVGGHVAVDVAERDQVRGEVRHLDADGLLAGDRGEDADLGGRERVAEVVLELRDLRHLGARRELELVARDARAGDLADDRRLDAEVREAGDERLARRAALARRSGPRPASSVEQRAVRQLVLGRRTSATSKSESCVSSVLLLRRQASRGRQRNSATAGGVGDEVGVVVHDVDGRPRARARVRGRLGSGSAPARGVGAGSRAAGRAVEARRTAWPERRRIAPSEAPVRKSTPASGEQDAEDRRARRCRAPSATSHSSRRRPSRRARVPSVSIRPSDRRARARAGTGRRRRARCASRSARRAGTSTTGAR